MKYLTILRHGKAIRSDQYPVDEDRPLAKRGFKDLGRVVAVMSQLSPPVDWIITSPARRARQSAQCVSDGLEFGDPLIVEPDIYESGVEAILPLLTAIPDELDHALMVGHNPVFEQLVSGLCSGSIGRMANSLPTSGVVHVELQIMRWDQIRWGSGQLMLYLRPRLLRGM